ncbi:MAG: hypothetical protein P8I93_02555 [Crocinitomicaceae bacterium]|nr:hypothetical protein [Crocinitomicaceae bacterium]
MKHLIYLFSLFFMVFISSCNKEKNTPPDAYLFEFEFDYNNSYYQNSNGQYISTNKGYLMDTMYMGDIPTPSANIYINDGQIGDTLISSCGSLNYLTNPSTSVKIWFPSSTLEDGVYNYDANATENDFVISIQKNMIFGNSGGHPNTLLESEWVADPYGMVTNIQNAQVKICHINSLIPEIRYAISTIEGDTIKGSYIGSLDKFKYLPIDADCD